MSSGFGAFHESCCNMEVFSIEETVILCVSGKDFLVTQHIMRSLQVSAACHKHRVHAEWLAAAKVSLKRPRASDGWGPHRTGEALRDFSLGIPFGNKVMKTVNKMKLEESNTPLSCLDREIQLLAMLDHPRIVRLYATWTTSAGSLLLDML